MAQNFISKCQARTNTKDRTSGSGVTDESGFKPRAVSASSGQPRSILHTARSTLTSMVFLELSLQCKPIT
jgi:hypothetical protein